MDGTTRLLLVSSNVSGNTRVSGKSYVLPEIPAADGEIEALERLFAEQRDAGRVRCVVDVRRDVTCEEMAELLEQGEYDAIHYAGHGFHSESPEESCLFFWEEPKGKQVQNAVKCLSANELNNLVVRARTKFVYLSCCQGAAVGVPAQLLKNDFLGIAHSLLLGGVPAVLSMRWPLSDDMAVVLALSFYKELLNGQGFETALLRARRQVQSRMPNDFNWLSPVLIMQGD
jgi:CHAT domain-containing protein